MTRRQRTARPRAILIATDAAHTRLRDVLTKQGFAVTMARSLIAGYEQIQRLLVPKQPAHPTMILLDTASADPDFPECPGTLLAAAVAGQMRRGSLQTAWLIGLSVDRKAGRDAEALVAGCQRVIHLPPTASDLTLLGRLAARPAPIPHADASPGEARAIHLLQAVSQGVLHAVQAAQMHAWTPDEVALLLHWLTPYPPVAGSPRQPAPVSASPASVQQLLRALGGVRAARRRLESIAEQWQTRYPLHSAVLQRFLEGRERREIVKYFEERRLYEDSRIYHCIKDLPRRIADQLRREQAMRHEIINGD